MSQTYGALLAQQQTPIQTVTLKNEFTGMVKCPMKQSRIAIMKCAENQKALGCGGPLPLALSRDGDRELYPWLKETGRCPTRATRQQIKELETRSEDPEGGGAKGIMRRYDRCQECGKKKKRTFALRCYRCGRIAAARRMRDLYGRR